MAFLAPSGSAGAALCTSLSLSVLGPPFLVAFAAAGSCSFAIPCLCMRARVGIYTIHTILSSFRLGCPWVFPHTIHVSFRGVGGLLFFICSLAVSTIWRWRPPLVLMAISSLSLQRRFATSWPASW